MESIVRNVSDLHADQRQWLESALGHQLRDNQQVIIQVLAVQNQAAPDEAGVEAAAPGGAAASDDEVPEWCRVYEGLSDEEIAEIEEIALRRADLTRPSP